MSHINDLPVDIIWRILYGTAVTPAKRLSEWKKKLPLVAVCRAWTKLAQPLVFNHVYVEYIKTSDNTCTVWKSNAELLIARQCTLMARRLTIGMVEFSAPDNLRHIALDILQLDRIDWMHIITLNFGEYSSSYDFPDEQAIASEPDGAEVARTMQYFGQNMRNIAELNLRRRGSKATEGILGTSFASMYGGRLQILRASDIYSLSIPHLSRHIAVLELSLDSSAARVLPSICGETLRVLRLDEVPCNFAWHHFRYDVFVRPIVFPRLVVLSLSYKYQPGNLTREEKQAKAALGAYNCDQLCFPVLKSLTIHNCTPDCDLLYADTPFTELKEVRLFGSLDELCCCSRLKLTWVKDLIINASLLDTDDMADFYSVSNHFFSSNFIGRSARLEFYSGHASIDPELIRWTNLTYLGMHTVSFETLCKLIARLPNLKGFTTINLELGTILADIFSIDESLFLSTDPLMAWGAKLATLTIQEFGDNYPEAATAIAIQALILHTGALKKFTVPRSAKSSVAAFIDEYKNRYPHLADIILFSKLCHPQRNTDWFLDLFLQQIKA